jgi:hypothetical protein
MDSESLKFTIPKEDPTGFLDIVKARLMKNAENKPEDTASVCKRQKRKELADLIEYHIRNFPELYNHLDDLNILVEEFFKRNNIKVRSKTGKPYIIYRLLSEYPSLNDAYVEFKRSRYGGGYQKEWKKQEEKYSGQKTAESFDSFRNLNKTAEKIQSKKAKAAPDNLVINEMLKAIAEGKEHPILDSTEDKPIDEKGLGFLKRI